VNNGEEEEEEELDADDDNDDDDDIEGFADASRICCCSSCMNVQRTPYKHVPVK
jgi:hypothetical protein